MTMKLYEEAAASAAEAAPPGPRPRLASRLSGSGPLK